MTISAEFLFSLPPERALEYFGGKQISKDWRNVWKDAHTKAFIIARETREQVLKDVYESLQEALKNGKTIDGFRYDALEKLYKSGWLSDSSGNADVSTTYGRLGRIYATNLNLAYSAGRYTAIMEGEFEFVEYIAVLDNRTRSTHRELDGKIFSVSDPALKIIAPPNGYNCRCRLRGLTENQVRKRGLDPDKLRADGQAKDRVRQVEVQTKSGAKSTVNVANIDGFPFRPEIGWDYNPAEAFWQMRIAKIKAERQIEDTEQQKKDEALRKQAEELKKKRELNKAVLKQMPFIQRAVPLNPMGKGTNPNFDKGKSYKVNCQRCVPTYELRRRGYNVEAMPKPLNNTINFGKDCFDNPEIHSVLYASDMIAQMKILPNGARCGISLKWKRGQGRHTFICEKINDKLHFFDPQSDAECAYYLDNYKDIIEWYRMDNLKFSEKIDWTTVVKKKD